MKDFIVKKSSIHGHGIFSKKEIQLGARVFIFPGKVVHRKIRTEKEAKRFINWIGLGEDLWLNPNQTSARHVNHSCEPNCKMIRRTLYAIKHILPGDEITIDYSLTDTDPLWKVVCACGARKCRKVIGSIFTLPPQIFKLNKPYIQPYFVRSYVAHLEQGGALSVGKKKCA